MHHKHALQEEQLFRGKQNAISHLNTEMTGIAALSKGCSKIKKIHEHPFAYTVYLTVFFQMKSGLLTNKSPWLLTNSNVTPHTGTGFVFKDNL